MYCVGVDRLGKVSSDSTLSRLLGVGSTHQITVFTDGVFAFKYLYHYRA